MDKQQEQIPEYTVDEILDLIIKELDSENIDRTENLSEYKRTL